MCIRDRHKYMRIADHFAASNDFYGELLRIKTENLMTENEISLLRENRIIPFYNSNLFHKILSAEKVEREYRFVSNLEQAQLKNYFSDMGNASVAVQGICDLIIFFNDKIIIADYKTDRTDSMETLKQKYASQLLIYKSAVEKIFRKSVSECILYSFFLNEEISF